METDNQQTYRIFLYYSILTIIYLFQNTIILYKSLNNVVLFCISKEYERYVGSFVQAQNNIVTYSDACAILHFVGESKETSSYDVLEDALEQMADSSANNRTRTVIEYIIDNDMTDFSPEAYEDAEKMLKEMLGR